MIVSRNIFFFREEREPPFTCHSSTIFTNSYSTRDRLLSSLTVKSAGSVTSTRPHLSTASLIDPLNMSIFAFRRIIVVSGFIKSTGHKTYFYLRKTSLNVQGQNQVWSVYICACVRERDVLEMNTNINLNFCLFFFSIFYLAFFSFFWCHHSKLQPCKCCN